MPKCARYYSPEMGRFISEDPIGLMGGINYFAYVGNSPCNFVDPLGLCSSGVYHFEGIEYGGFLFVVGVKSAHLTFTCTSDPNDTFTATFTSIAIGGGLGGGVGTPAGAVKGCNDEIGSRTSMTRDNVPVKLPPGVTGAQYDNANRLTSFNNQTVLHDENGNIISWGDKNFIWDSRNRLVEVKESGQTIATFAYDALGRRVEKTVNGNTTKYLYDGLDIVMETDASGTPTVFYVRTLNIDEPLARIELNTGNIRYYHADALGSIIALTDDSGTVKTRYNYSPFGDAETIGEASANPFMFTGREWDGDTGLYYYRLRYQSPVLGRFISEDPIGFEDGDVNFYCYVRNSPLNYTDPTGEVAQWVIITAGVVLVVYIVEEYVVPFIYILKGHPEEPLELQPHLDLAVCHPVDPRTLRPERLPQQPPQRPKPQRPSRPSVRR